MQRHKSVKKNTVFNGEFVLDDKRANKSVSTRNYELFSTSDLQEWYASRVDEPVLASLDEFQERDSGWTLSRILNLTISVNKYNPLRFENLNNISINVYCIEEQNKILPLRLTINNNNNKIIIKTNFFFPRCLRYFSSSAKLELHSVDCGKLNDCAIILPSEDDKWLEFKNHCRKERVPFVVYADWSVHWRRWIRSPHHPRTLINITTSSVSGITYTARTTAHRQIISFVAIIIVYRGSRAN
ncbi:hypothetical protein ALC62_12072 [Cyphomyrmex costatus]|uniref:Uncharacterized protein n=1 Tax=Cyphomyrmex costatus TaxID=456900 RepID=A0A151IC21_9HYME|nr:hypothetical protein ALC62_12072 [Cyphomyrmex costatus]